MRASLFITCYNDTLFPETGRAVVRLLERLGVELDFHPKQTCCGQMHANTGFRGEAFCQAKRFVRMYQDAETVVIPSSSCVAMIRDQYPGLFEELGNEELRQAVCGAAAAGVRAERIPCGQAWTWTMWARISRTALRITRAAMDCAGCTWATGRGG